jgi:hypothetical protein
MAKDTIPSDFTIIGEFQFRVGSMSILSIADDHLSRAAGDIQIGGAKHEIPTHMLSRREGVGRHVQKRMRCHDEGTKACCEALKKTGKLLTVEQLEPIQTAMTVRVRNGKAPVTDGPFAETKGQIGGYFLIDARDLNEAI